MLDFLWKCFFCVLALISMARCEGIRTANGILHHTPISPHRQVRSQETVRGQSDPWKNVEKMAYELLKDEKGAISRRKRNILFPSGVQLCAEETVQQAIANHLSYYHLRVCQETVWEAFKIFWDRLPDREEYYHWFSMCQEGTIGVFEIGSTFSQSEEHIALVHSRILTTSVKSHETTVPPTEQVAFTTQKDETISTLRPEMSLADITPEVTPEATAEAEEGVTTEIPKSITTGITNDIELDTIAWPLLQQGEQVVELSIQLKGELFRDALRDSSSHDYQHLAQQFTEKIEDAFENLPGFTKVNILEFRQPEDARGMVVVHYAMTLEVGAGGISNETMDYINMQSNMVENSYLESNERPTVVYTISDIRSYITEALHKDSFMGNDTLTIDLDSLQLKSVDSSLAQGAINPTTGPSNDDMVNVLASEKPPGMELTDNNIYISGIKKDDFLFDTAHPYEPWMGSQNAEAGENDVIILEVSPTLAPPEVPDETFDLNFESIPKSEYSPLVLNTDGNGDTEAEEFLVSSTVVTEATPTDSPGKDNVHLELGPVSEPTAAVIPLIPVTSLDNSLDMGSGSGLSGDGPAADIWPWFSVMSGEELGGPGMERKSIGEEDPTSELNAELMEEGVEEFTEEPQVLNVQDHELEEYLDPIQTVSVEQEEEHEEDLIKDQTFLDRVLVTQNILMHPQYMTTEKPPVFWTMETLTVELSMQTEASGIYDDYYVNEASTIMMPVTDFPVALDDPTTETPLLQRLTTTGQELTDSKNIEESLEEHETLPTTKPTSSTDMEAVLLPVTPATLAPTTNTPVSQPFIPESSEVDLDLETNFEQETIEAIEVEESLGTTTLPSEVSQPPTKFTTIDDVDSVMTEIALTNLPPFYQPTFRPTEKLFDIAINSNEERNIKLELGVSVPTLTNETGDQMDPEHTITPEIENYALDAANITEPDILFDLFHYGGTAQTEEESSGYPSSFAHGTDMASVSMTANKGRALMVFFSLRVTNMMFSEDLFNKSSPEYKALEQRFLELLVPYLQSNLSNFQNLEILNFRNGSIVVNSRMKFAKPVPHGVTNSVYLILEEFCNTAYQTMNLAIDKYSLDVESGDRADPCKFQACNEFSLCMVNRWSGEAECVCNAGYFSVEGLPCQSICDLQHDFCLNDGKCDIIPGQGAICRCRVGENWWFRGAHCEEYVSEPLVVGIAIASVAGFLLVASAVIFFLARTMRDQYDKEDSEDPIHHEDSAPSLERATKYNPMYESDATTGYSHYYRRYPEAACYSSASAEASTDFSSEEIRHIYENSELTKEEIQDRIRIIELYAKDRQFADFMRQHQVAIDIRRDSSSTS